MDKTEFDASIYEVMTLTDDWISAQEVYEQLMVQFGRATPSKKCIRNHMEGLVDRNMAEKMIVPAHGGKAYHFRLIA